MNLTHTLELFDTPKTARVDCPITAEAKGRVFFEGTYWPAQVYQGDTSTDSALAVSTWVRVLGRQGLTLLVAPVVEAYA